MNIKNEKQKLLEQLYEPYKKCLMCPLARQGRINVVFGAGNPDANLMIVGEAPGEQEDRLGQPFMGRSGKLLTSIFDSLQIFRKDIYITNIVKCRPPKNRTPDKNESFTCKNLLLEKQIRIIQPRVICTLGSAALEGFLQKKISISALRGSLIQCENLSIFPTYHPAYALRNKKNVDLLMKDIQTANLIAINQPKPRTAE